MHNKLNEKLPPFLNLGTLGLNLGMQGAQFTATSTTAENQMLSNPMSIHSISCNGDNQDIVSMGTNAALICSKVIENAYEVLAIELLSIVQAVDALNVEGQLSTNSQNIYEQIRKLNKRFKNDGILYKDLKNIKTYLKEHNPDII